MSKTSEVNTNIDTITNILNVVLIIIGAFLIVTAIYLLGQTIYPYLVNLGIAMIIAGCITIGIGLLGFTWHLKVARKMAAEAKANLNY